MNSMLAGYLRVAFYMIRAKPIRSVLSLLGIYIGVLSLIIILAIHEGVRQELEGLYRTREALIVMIFPGFNEATHQIGRLTSDEVQRLSALHDVKSVLQRLSQEAELRSPSGVLQAHVAGIDTAFVPLYRVPLKRGRLFLASEVATRQPVCLLTESAARKLFPVTDPIQNRITFLGATFQVVGIVDWQEAVSQRTFFMSDPDVLVPFTWLSKNKEGMIAPLEVRLRPDMSPQEAVDLARDEISHHDAERAKAYSIMTLDNFFRKKRESNERTLRSLLAIAAVSLLVGGIGVANVMLTSVTERTREVGLRKALGARRRDILIQFLVESSVLTATGGLLAAVSAWLVVNIIPSLIKDAPNWVFPGWEVGACLVLTMLIGLVAGLYPASRAAALSPVEALRYE